MPHTQRPVVAYADPLHAGRHPFQTFMLVFCCAAGAPLIFGEPTAQSIQALLPSWMANAWGVSLTTGSLVALVGSYWPRRNYATALTLERVGLLVMGFAALVYGCVILIYGGLGGSAAGLIVLALGGSAVVRARDIGRVIHRAIAMRGPEPMPRPFREGEE